MNIKDFDVEMWMNIYENDCVYNLSETCACPLSVEELLDISGQKEKIINDIMNIKLDYGEIVGSRRLRLAISGLYKNISPEAVTMAHGAIGANSLALLAIVERGDHVVSVVPTYQQHYSLPESIGADITLVKLREDKGWMPDLDELEKAVTPATKVICLNNPNNPTGAIMSDDFLMKITEIARKNDAYIFCDEAYRGLNHSGNPFGSSIADLYEKGIVTGSMSKTFALPGLRLGWVAGPDEIIADINRHRDYHIISVGKIDEYLSAVAIENKEAVLARNLSICCQNLDLISDWIDSEPHLSFVRPQASTTSFVKFDLDMGSEEFCRRMQKEAGVMFVPGKAFTLDDHFRLGFGNSTEIIKGGINAASQWLKQF